MGEKLEPQKKVGRPTNDERAAKQSRPVRIPIGQARDKLTVQAKDETTKKKWYIRWVRDTSEDGHRIQIFRDAGFTFVGTNDGYRVVKQDRYDSTSGHGSIYRKPSGKDGEWLYLMKQPIEYHLEDQARKSKETAAVLDQMRPRSKHGRDIESEGLYGEIDIQRGPDNRPN
jgi:hypothetical protein